MEDKKYLNIVSHLESCLEKYGDSNRGVDWPKKADVDTRYRVMLEIIRDDSRRNSLLDFGCGASHLYEYILRHKLDHIAYSGLDISPKFVELSRQKHPEVHYYCLDILDGTDQLPQFDYIVMNGVFTEKRELSFEEMRTYFESVVTKVFQKARVGIAFNVISKEVDWEREDIFYLPFDTLASFLVQDVSRHFVIRHDYLMYEYTTYVFHRLDNAQSWQRLPS